MFIIKSQKTVICPPVRNWPRAAQIFDITGEKMQLILDFPTIGEPHYAQAVAADVIRNNSVKFYKLEENTNAFVSKGEAETKVVRKGNRVDIYITAIRSHFSPDNIEGIKMGDEVYWHVTNLEQDWDVPHGFAIKGALTGELLVMPGETQTLKWTPEKPGHVSFLLYRFLQRAASGNAGLCKGFAKRKQYRPFIQHG